MGVSSSESHDLTAFYEMLSASFGVLSQNTGFYPSLDRIIETTLGPLNLGPGGGSYNEPISRLQRPASTLCISSKSISLHAINFFPTSLSFGSARTGMFLPILGLLTISMLFSHLMKSLDIPCVLVVQLHSRLLGPPCSKSKILVVGLPMLSSSIFKKTHFLSRVLLLGAQLSMPNRMIISSYFTTFLPPASLVTICVFMVILSIGMHHNKIGHLGHPNYSKLFCPISCSLLPRDELN